MNTDNPKAQRHTTHKTIEENMADLFWGQSVYDISPKKDDQCRYQGALLSVGAILEIRNLH